MSNIRIFTNPATCYVTFGFRCYQWVWYDSKENHDKRCTCDLVTPFDYKFLETYIKDETEAHKPIFISVDYELHLPHEPTEDMIRKLESNVQAFWNCILLNTDDTTYVYINNKCTAFDINKYRPIESKTKSAAKTT